VVRLHDHGEREPRAALEHRLVVARRDEHGARGVDPRAPDEQLRQPLVERDRVRVRVAPRVRDAELLEQRRVERLAHPPGGALGRVEDEVRIDRLEPLEEVPRRSRHLDLLDLVPRGLDRRRDRVHGLGAVVLGLLLGLADVGQP
jgi:hypothetical protein